jgi:RNA polymerase sigma-70 factor (ECF subfamily)
MSDDGTTMDGLLRHAGWLRRFAAALVGDRTAGEDVAQETLLSAWRRRPETVRDVRPWLATVASNEARDRARGETRRAAREQGAGDALAAVVSTPERLVADAEAHRVIAAIVSGLEEPFREAIVLRYYDGLSAADVARRLGVPAATVRSRLIRGLERVRAELDARHGGDRKVWLRALLPLLPARPPLGFGPLAKLAAVAALGALGLTAAVVVVGSARPLAIAGGDSVIPATAALVLAEAPMASAPGPLSAELLACHDRLRGVHGKLVSVEDDLIRWDPEFVFSLGEANPAAERALAPVLESIFAGGTKGGPKPLLDQSFRCRSWGCRLAVRFPEPRQNYWWPGFKAALEDRVLGWSASVRDGDEGLPATEGTFVFVVTMRLRQSSAERSGGVVLTPPPRALVLPATAAACEADAATLEQALAVDQARWAEVEPPGHKFARFPENPDLVPWVEARVPWFTKLLAKTECRGLVCKQTNAVPLMGRIFWEKPVGNARKTSFGHLDDSVVYHELDREP